MLSLFFESEKDQESILSEAIKYFVDEVGLKVIQQDPYCVTFNGDGDKVGYVTVTLTQEGKKFQVKLETREFEYWVKKFVRKFK
ncbi:MAG: hypothetical protein JSV51_09280 [Candidatus Bathyarchaeota archaeon]|nr:MAG: hypothetical protein JSV51_09280 [Candidatus Bathyarchaeota archaeon]